jgi:hypothetical protein
MPKSGKDDKKGKKGGAALPKEVDPQLYQRKVK